MNRDRARELLPIIQAFADGEEIELKCHSGWISHSSLDFSCNPNEYRIKPREPREFFVSAYARNGDHILPPPYAKNDQDFILVREVLND